MSKKKVIVIGGGIAGMESSSCLSAMGYEVTLLEKQAELGGHLLNWDRLFPTMRNGSEVLDYLKNGISEKTNVFTKAEVQHIERRSEMFNVQLQNGMKLDSDAILVATGYDLFDAQKKEEYGYGIYENVITSAELEEMFKHHRKIQIASGKAPKRIGFVHCVGSRDEKAGNTYCSKVCCVTAVKQAIEVKEQIPDCEVFCFYMDLRMFGINYESMYKEAQVKWGVQFIRGRVSETFGNENGTVHVKVEDTLAGRPLKLNVDLLVLMVGFVPSQGSKQIGNLLGLQSGVNGFFKIADQHTLTNVSNKVPGVFFAGTCTAPGTITDTITDARAAATKIACYLEGAEIEKKLRYSE